MFVKICGVTNEEDALMAVAFGADAIGFVFAPSKRQVKMPVAREIARRLPQEILTVGVFRDQASKTVIDTIQSAGLKGAQLHGHETPEDAAAVRPYAQVLIVAFPAGDPGLNHVDEYGADAVLLDSHAPGSGEVFDWSLTEGAPMNRRLLLAGGLTAENVAIGISEVRPWGVDVSTGVEVDGDPLRKDPRKVQAFIRAAKAAGKQVAGSQTRAGTDTTPDPAGPFDWSDAGI
ncbi:MAG TPA: phosphoribosylanthranilate isomerase [Microthrixaceae bacterium]|nr:phosphoribosylanthranilate isomerase [Microthrixaceae bacterium]